jgi:alanine racemase
MDNIELARVTDALEVHTSFHCHIEHLSIDSRTIIYPSNTIYIAIKGERNDGHQFIHDCYINGVRNFIVSDKIDLKRYPDCNFYLVNNSLIALQNLAMYKRSLFHKPVIAITGSNGKTIVKEWLSQLLSPDYIICKNPKSYNSQVGVPLSVWQLSNSDDIGIFEAGISTKNEMSKLANIIQPTLGIFTNIGHAHDAGFDSREQKTREKLSLFDHAEYIVYCKDHSMIDEAVKAWQSSQSTLAKFITWSTKSNADLVITKIESEGKTTALKAIYNNQFLELKIPFIDQASIENLIHCWCVLLFFNVSSEQILSRMNELHAVGMRLELREAINNCIVIDDAYNNDIDSLKIGIEYLQAQPGNKKSLIISDILQSSLDDERLYKQVSEILNSKDLYRVITVGSRIHSYAKEFKNCKYSFQTTEELVQSNVLNELESETILLKGARQFEFENLSKALQRKNHETQLEVNLSALIHNYHFYKSRLEKDVKVMAMVKAFSYGSGSYEVASILEYNKVDYLAVAYIDEGIELRKKGIRKPIMVMNSNFESIEKLKAYDLEPEVYSLQKLKQMVAWLKNQPSKQQEMKIHLKLDTGMRRLGFVKSDLEELIHLLRMNSQLKVVSVFSHLVASDAAEHDEFTNQQIRLFEQMTGEINSALGYSFLRHILNSGGITRFKHAQYEMVRLGIGMYGISNQHEEKKHLENVCNLKTTISQVKQVEANETIGYNRRGMIEKGGKIATIPIGYADGFRRSLGNGNYTVIIQGVECPTVGNICMDMCMIDVSRIDCKEGDEVIVFGSQKPIEVYAEAMETIAYEALTSVSERVKRIYMKE